MYNRAEVIQKIIDHTGAKRYLEIGVAHAETFLKVKVDHRIGVDPERPSQHLVNAFAQVMAQSLNHTPAIHLGCNIDRTDISIEVKNCSQPGQSADMNAEAEGTSLQNSTQYYQMTSDDFFTQADTIVGPLGIDVAFVDGLHEWKQAVRDVENCLRYLNNGGVIVMHDCSPISELIATPFDRLEEAKKDPKWDGAWTGDVWKAVAWLRSAHHDLRFTAFNCDWGVGVITRGRPDSVLRYTRDEVAELPYEKLDQNRSRILNLKDPSNLDDFVAALPVLGQPKEEVEPAGA
ncbi:MAG: class I SAM-dependent methyltransferase [Candidatus Zixiibacteriota bacterium]|nr:MAG: class I SAM-dependent methyltransferase [candidate division Zixibacteria bacterium]